MKYLSLFSGIGGFELGIKQAYEIHNESKTKGLHTKNNSTVNNTEPLQRAPTCIGYSEIDKYACQIYRKRFPKHKNYGNIKELNAEDLPEFELLVGGFPCQAFSIAGNRGGFDDTRGTLFFDIARIAQQKQPRLLVLENVKGLLSHDKGRTFRTIITTLDELGYDLQWQVLNSKYHGVPQNRERVFIVGHLRGTPRPKVFPIGGSDREHTESNRQGDDVAHTIQGGGDKHRGSYVVEKGLERIAGGGQGQRVYDTDGIGKTLAGEAGGQGAKMGLYESGGKIRKLTPKECERLQGFPDGWTKTGIDKDGNQVEISDTQRYKTLGNAVTVNVVERIMTEVLEQ